MMKRFADSLQVLCGSKLSLILIDIGCCSGAVDFPFKDPVLLRSRESRGPKDLLMSCSLFLTDLPADELDDKQFPGEFRDGVDMGVSTNGEPTNNG